MSKETKVVVTRDTIHTMLQNPNPNYVMNVVGRALVGIYNRQTEHEKVINTTTNSNGVGFAGCDAKGGSLSAKYFLKHKRLETWMINKWLKVSGVSGYPRLCKYHKQLNDIALQKVQQ
jgi:hypothetical protein